MALEEDAADLANLADDADAADVVEATDVGQEADATDLADLADMAGVAEAAEVADVAETAEVAYVAEVAEVADVAGLADVADAVDVIVFNRLHPPPHPAQQWAPFAMRCHFAPTCVEPTPTPIPRHTLPAVRTSAKRKAIGEQSLRRIVSVAHHISFR